MERGGAGRDLRRLIPKSIGQMNGLLGVDRLTELASCSTEIRETLAYVLGKLLAAMIA